MDELDRAFLLIFMDNWPELFPGKFSVHSMLSSSTITRPFTSVFPSQKLDLLPGL